MIFVHVGRKSLQGLNYFVVDGSKAFEDLVTLCNQ